ncbi:hypothetical protein DE146DRAFT_789195 [Phaeosphaeria sp. MPI-PUGE-AT-0046c]|nr:hypothetical protein DE146DRAFT_789195 [Phaeosphaeria sp. MPI-PUGE-AT-0046c]
MPRYKYLSSPHKQSTPTKDPPQSSTMIFFKILTLATALLAAPALAKEKGNYYPGVACTPARESVRKCVAPFQPRFPVNMRYNVVVECEKGQWQVVEKCGRFKPCIDPDVGEAYCDNDFDARKDPCPKGESCAY